MVKAGDEQNNELQPRSMSETWSTYHMLANDATTVNHSAQTASLPFGMGNAKVYSTGDIVDKSYKLLALLGSGSMGVVFHCRHLILGKDYALKLLATDRVTDESWSRFQSEAKALARLHHPGVVGIHNMGIDDQACPYYIMDLLTGESLSQLIRRKKRLSLTDALDIFSQLASALDAAHQQGIIHRDIKPSNIMVNEEGGKYSVKLVDFGIARLSKRGLGSLNQTAAGTVFGTPFYMSPEQSLGKTVDERSDIYSLGCTLFEALTGIPPLVGDNAIETILMHQSADMPTLNEVYPDGHFPDSIEIAIGKMLARNVGGRYQTMKQISHDFARIKAGKEVGFSKESGKSTAAPFSNTDDDSDEELYDDGDNHHSDGTAGITRDSRIFGPLQMALVAFVLLIFTTSAFAIYMFTRSKAPEDKASVKKLNLDLVNFENQDPLNAAVSANLHTLKNHMGNYKTFCTQTTNANGAVTRQFHFPETKCSFGYLRVDNGPYQPAIGNISVPLNEKAYLYLQCVCTPYPEVCSKFGPTDLNGLEIVTFKVPEVLNSLKHWRNLEHLSLFNSIERVEGIDCSIILRDQLPLIDELSNLRSLGLCGGLLTGKPIHGEEVTGPDIAKMKLLSKLSTLSVQEVSHIQPLLSALADHPNIREVNLVRLEIRDDDLKLLLKAKNLETLRIFQCNRITPAAAEILKKMPNLKHVIIDRAWLDVEKQNFKKSVSGYVYENYKTNRHN